MGKILDAFLTDQLHVDSVSEKRSPEHQELCEKWYNLQEKLSKSLNSEEKELLTELVDTLFHQRSQTG